MRSNSIITLLAAAVGIALAFAYPALGKDSDAPAAAGDRWLPCEPWVRYHWLPFDERRLLRMTGIKRWELKRWIQDDDRHTLGQLLKRRGHDPETVAELLLADRLGTIGGTRYSELLRRSNALMTQGHLAQHVFFHYFHNPVLAENSQRIFGIESGDYHRARLRGWTPREIAARGGRTMASAEREAMRTMSLSQSEGVIRGETTREQADAFLRAQRRWIENWRVQSIHAHRKSEFPRGNTSARGSRLERACTYMAGSSHVDGSHDGANHRPFATAAYPFELFCHLSAGADG